VAADEAKVKAATSESIEEGEEAAPPAEAEEVGEEIEIVEEKFYTVNFRDAWKNPRKRRTPKAAKILVDFVKRNMKIDDVRVSEEINSKIWSRSLQKPPRRLRIRAVKDREGKVTIFPAEAL
jgi:large subunit ribosomal protein L31e